MTFTIIVLLQLSQYAIVRDDTMIELVIGGIAIVFFFVGLFIQKKFKGNKLPEQVVDQKAIATSGLSKREYEVLEEMAQGYSNKEIAETLFVSESTIKTHVSNILVKLDARRRTQAIQKAKELRILGS